MAELTTDKTIFGANGAFDPEVFKTGVGVSRKIDFSLAPLNAASGATKNFEFLALPASFVITGLYVEELEACDAATITIKAKSDSATIGSAVNVGGSTLLKSVQNITAKVLAAGDVLCLCITGGQSAATAIAKGLLKVNVVGYLPDGDAMANFAVSVPYRTSGQEAGANASKGDIYLKR